MVRSAARSPDEYLSELPPDRREAVAKVRDVVLRKSLDRSVAHYQAVRGSLRKARSSAGT